MKLFKRIFKRKKKHVYKNGTCGVFIGYQAGYSQVSGNGSFIGYEAGNNLNK